MSKKKIIYLTSAIFLCIIVILGIVILNSGTKDSRRFKKEYEKYNNKQTSDNRKYQKLSISRKNKIKYISLDESLDIIDDGTGLIYFGFPDCPWCRGMIPTLLKVTNDSNLENLYYVDMTGLRDSYVVTDDGEIKKSEEAKDNYYKLLKVLDKYLDSYIVTDRDGIEYDTLEKRLYVPFVLAVEEGIIRDTHTGSVILEEDQSPYDKLTQKQENELEAVFERMIDSIENTPQVCDENC